MRHQKAGRKLSRTSSHREAMLRNMVTSLFKHEQIETTEAKAKELRSVAEKIITLAKRGDLHARRQALAYMKEKSTTHKVFDELKERYLDRQGGYLRIIKKSRRKGDGASISVVQLLPGAEGDKKSKKKGKTPATSKKAGGSKEKKRLNAKDKEKENRARSPEKGSSEEKES
jgi:large subunit ribosomal protein L17